MGRPEIRGRCCLTKLETWHYKHSPWRFVLVIAAFVTPRRERHAFQCNKCSLRRAALSVLDGYRQRWNSGLPGLHDRGSGQCFGLVPVAAQEAVAPLVTPSVRLIAHTVILLLLFHDPATAPNRPVSGEYVYPFS